MSFLGRTTSGDMGWSKRQITLVTASLGLAALHGLVGLLEVVTGNAKLALGQLVILLPVVLAIFTGLPRERGPVRVAVDQGAYRAGPPPPAIEPPKVSHGFMDVVLTLFVFLHVAAVGAAILAAIGGLLLVGLVAFLCSKH